MNPIKKNYLSLIISGLLSISLVFFVIYPLLISIKKNSGELISQRQKFSLLARKNENLKELKELYQKIEPNLDKIEHCFVNQELPIRFIGFLEETSKQSSASIKIFPLSQKKEENETLPSLRFQLTLNSSFPNFLKFLEKLEASPYLVEVSDLNLERLSEKNIKTKKLEGASAGDIRATLTIKAYAL